ncbi:MAG: metalloregulator ArsR/SmtB family transcription factor [Bacillota bacterium]|nr:metalloregulator ArsR/SmtB family transcription factor [Bacillota bacterium]
MDPLGKDTIAVCSEVCVHPAAVEHVREEMLDEQEINRLAETFKVLGDPTRIKILSALATEELCVCDLAAALEMSVSAISHQLRVLKGARLVKYRREGKNIFYSLDDDHVISLFRLALEHVRHN